jgi:hypothetical protein
MLYGCYNQYNRMDTDAIKAGFEELYEKMAGMPLRDMDDIIYTTVPSAESMKNPASWKVSR